MIFSFQQLVDRPTIHCFSVGLAKLLFPMEAKVVMHITPIDGTSEFTPNLGGYQRTTMDLNEAPFKIKEEHLIRMKALSRAGNIYMFHHLLLNFANCCLYFILIFWSS